MARHGGAPSGDPRNVRKRWYASASDACANGSRSSRSTGRAVPTMRFHAATSIGTKPVFAGMKRDEEPSWLAESRSSPVSRASSRNSFSDSACVLSAPLETAAAMRGSAAIASSTEKTWTCAVPSRLAKLKRSRGDNQSLVDHASTSTTPLGVIRLAAIEDSRSVASRCASIQLSSSTGGCWSFGSPRPPKRYRTCSSVVEREPRASCDAVGTTRRQSASNHRLNAESMRVVRTVFHGMATTASNPAGRARFSLDSSCAAKSIALNAGTPVTGSGDSSSGRRPAESPASSPTGPDAGP